MVQVGLQVVDYIMGVGVAAKKWSSYFPIRRQGGGNLDEDIVYVGYVVYFGSTKRDVMFHNACMT